MKMKVWLTKHWPLNLINRKGILKYVLYLRVEMCFNHWVFVSLSVMSDSL